MTEGLKVCRLKLKKRLIKCYRLVAVDTCCFIERILDETGLELKIVEKKQIGYFYLFELLCSFNFLIFRKKICGQMVSDP
ncbi:MULTISPECIES: hypothetical protein [Bartonella]|uniref:Uncharacterized protein n=1 Tax=Bartonella rochalimae ATCC BAA-1498 TaxID=685782 RepID=E6YMZ8_9HYPH|nr:MULTISPECIES: hypothetical protein [Bartonella]AQX18010.1 hypothetical protein BA1379B_001630 [Bartonella sp. A1379B]KEC56303.1 hypothetical protein O99_00620 [Bartonella rochalimae ATCC BAA-1498]CBI78236.1 hypothetical protein BARRO_80100 [Bartonella rochalimae ATCC BAA-1498]